MWVVCDDKGEVMKWHAWPVSQTVIKEKSMMRCEVGTHLVKRLWYIYLM